jgi:hypothetical protein
VKAAEAVAGPVEHARVASSAVHYGMAALTGAVYGLVRDSLPLRGARGPTYGAAVWLVADELAVPALGLGSWRAPVCTHARALVAHLAYGIVLDRALRRMGC